MHILLPIDSEEERAIKMAEAVGTLPAADESVQVTILNVAEQVTVKGEGGVADSSDWYDETEFPQSVDAAKEILESNGIAVDLLREHGDPTAVILDTADRLDIDWILMRGRTRTPVGKVLFGSVTQAVLLDSEKPVVVV